MDGGPAAPASTETDDGIQENPGSGVQQHHCGACPEKALIESAGSRVADAIVEQAKRWRADLIVIGTHGRRGINRMVLGSDAELVVRYSPVPVLLVPARRA